MQYLCDLATDALEQDPHDDAALGAYLRGTFHDEPYLHRGSNLETVAELLEDGPRKALLLALHGFIPAAVYEPGDGARWLERAATIDPSLGWQQVAGPLQPILSRDAVDGRVTAAADAVTAWFARAPHALIEE